MLPTSLIQRIFPDNKDTIYIYEYVCAFNYLHKKNAYDMRLLII